MTGAVVRHFTVRNRDQIAPEDPVIGAQFNVARHRLNRRTPGIAPPRVITKQAHLRDIAARLHIRRDRPHQPQPASPADFIHIGRVGGLKRGLIAKLLYRLIRRSIRHNYHVLCHTLLLTFYP
jgi:hypothetical protein